MLEQTKESEHTDVSIAMLCRRAIEVSQSNMAAVTPKSTLSGNFSFWGMQTLLLCQSGRSAGTGAV
jgi:hypothetical protein